MPDYLLDTSALVKYYHPEPGSGGVIQLVGQAGVGLFISDLTIIEMHSALAKRVRIGAITRTAYTGNRLRFEADVAAGRFAIVQITHQHKEAAIGLLKKHAPTRALRTLDALQLAVAVELKAQGKLDYFVTADDRFGKVVNLERIKVINPET